MRAAALKSAVAVWLLFYVLVAVEGGAGFDSHAYWLTRSGLHYAADPGAQNAYLYSPAFAQAIRPLALLPWPVFALLWSSLATATYLWLARAVDPRLRVPLLALCAGDVVYGNVWWLFAIVLAHGLRRPALWALPALVKVTPAVGFVWFAVRREWRQLAIAVGTTAAVAAVSIWVAPGEWTAWLGLLRHGHTSQFPDEPLPRALRLLAALALTVFAARRDRARLLPAALWLAAPMLSLNGLGVLLVAAMQPGPVPAPSLGLSRLRGSLASAP